MHDEIPRLALGIIIGHLDLALSLFVPDVGRKVAVHGGLLVGRRRSAIKTEQETVGRSWSERQAGQKGTGRLSVKVAERRSQEEEMNRSTLIVG
jgi:hypothetical protein